MAERENIRDRSRRVNPAGLALIDKVDEALRAVGARGVSVHLTEDMTPEEEEMALFTGFLQEGHPVETATRKTKEWLAIIHRADTR